MRPPTSPWCVWHCVLTLTVALAAGCVQTPAEEAEHVHYDFEPADFPDAVNQLAALQLRIESDQADDDQLREPADAPDALEEDSHHGHSDGHEDVPPLKQWHLIVRWLPEIAADSDLKREAWERIAGPAKRLFDVTNAWEQLPPEEQKSLFRSRRQEISGILEELKALALSEYPTDAGSERFFEAEED